MISAPTILCIDDEKTGLRVRALMLEYAGYRVLRACNGEEGLRLLDSHEVDLVIMDYWLPDMDGVELIKRIRDANPVVPLAVLTGSGELVDLPEDAGIDRVLSKPIPPEELRSAVDEMLRERASA